MKNLLSSHEKEQIRQVTQKYGARKVRLFGSVARREATAASDLDLLVDLSPGSTLLDLVAMKQDLEDLLHRKVDLVTEAALSPYIRENVLREAVAL